MSRHDDHVLRLFVLARRAGDEAAARHHWEALVTANFDRVRGWVLLESRGRLSADEVDEAVSRALVKLANNMIRTFRGTTMGEWVNATKTLVHGVCVDTQRHFEAVNRRRAPLEDEAALHHRVHVALERERQAEETDTEDEARYGAFFEWAVPQLSANRRAVIELDRAGVPVGEIQTRLSLSRDAVYASRSRALKDLAGLRREWSP